MGSRRTLELAFAPCVLAGLLATLAACGDEDEPSSDPQGDAGGSKAVAGHGGGRRDAATADAGRDAAASSTRKDAAQGDEPGEPDAAGAGAEPDAGAAEPDSGVETPPEIDASVPTTCDLSCAAGERCELVQVTCVRAPCPPVPSCVKIESVSCDPRLILCRRATPECPQWQVPSVSGSCFGPCVPVEQCACDEPADCPDPDHFTCHRSAAHCGPYVQ